MTWTREGEPVCFPLLEREKNWEASNLGKILGFGVFPKMIFVASDEVIKDNAPRGVVMFDFAGSFESILVLSQSANGSEEGMLSFLPLA